MEGNPRSHGFRFHARGVLAAEKRVERATAMLESADGRIDWSPPGIKRNEAIVAYLNAYTDTAE